MSTNTLRVIIKGKIEQLDLLEIQGALLRETIEIAKEKIVPRFREQFVDMMLLCPQIQKIDRTGASFIGKVASNLKPRRGRLHIVGFSVKMEAYLKEKINSDNIIFHATEEEAFSYLDIRAGAFESLGASKEGSLHKERRQIAIKDHIRGKKILFKHHEDAHVRDIISYLKATYSHFQNAAIELHFENVKIPEEATIEELFRKYGYTESKLLTVCEIAEAKSLLEKLRQGGDRYEKVFLRILLEKEVLSSELGESIEEIAKLNRESIVTTVIEGNYVEEDVLIKTIGEYLELPIVDFRSDDIDPNAGDFLPREIAEKYCVLPLRKDAKVLRLAMCNPLDEKLLDSLRSESGFDIEGFLAADVSILGKMDEWYDDLEDDLEDIPEDVPEPEPEPESEPEPKLKSESKRKLNLDEELDLKLKSEVSQTIEDYNSTKAKQESEEDDEDELDPLDHELSGYFGVSDFSEPFLESSDVEMSMEYFDNENKRVELTSLAYSFEIWESFCEGMQEEDSCTDLIQYFGKAMMARKIFSWLTIEIDPFLAEYFSNKMYYFSNEEKKDPEREFKNINEYKQLSEKTTPITKDFITRSPDGTIYIVIHLPMMNSSLRLYGSIADTSFFSHEEIWRIIHLFWQWGHFAIEKSALRSREE